MPSHASPRCGHCGKAIDGEYVVYDNDKLHRSCFNTIRPRCDICGLAIDKQYVIYDNHTYHEACYKISVAKKCDICGQAIMGKYRVDSWGVTYHEGHEVELPECDYCGRLISDMSTGGGMKYADDRKICNLCKATAVSDDAKVAAVAREVQAILKRAGIDVDMSDVPIVLLDKPSLAKFTGSGFNPKEMGLAHYEFSERFGRKFREKCTIYILYGLPRRTFEGVLAHEMMHVWTYKNLETQPALDIAEGFANFGSYTVYSARGDKMADFLIENLFQDPDPYYGDGFRRVERFVKRDGMANLIKRLKRGQGLD